ncbi:hypothetical protein AB4Z50_14480 [Paenibacillus sp. 2TAB26]|uniref:hypothetical protein n=1 Tax=Paenibacillus sp. 2TAB26 TaxID=3233005 RepID=UPI003F9B6A54
MSLKSFLFWKKNFIKEIEPEASSIKQNFDPVQFQHISHINYASPLLKVVKNAHKDRGSADIYLAFTRDKSDHEIIISVDLDEFNNMYGSKSTASLALRLYYKVSEYPSPSYMYLKYESLKNRIIINDCNANAKIRREGHGSIMLHHAKELCTFLNQLIDQKNQVLLLEYKDKPEVLCDWLTNDSGYIKGRIKYIFGEIFPDNSLSREDLINFYDTNAALKVHISID